jgi:hypothetical protein
MVRVIWCHISAGLGIVPTVRSQWLYVPVGRKNQEIILKKIPIT